MQIEHISRICLTSRWTAKDQRYLTISHSLFTQVIINDKSGETTVTEIFTDGSTCEWRIILHCSRICRCCRYHDSIRQSAVFLKGLHKCSYRRSLLTYCYIDTIYRFTLFIETLLIDNGINSNSRLTSLTVTDDKFTLTTSYRNH